MVNKSTVESLLGSSSSYADMNKQERTYFLELLKEEMRRREEFGNVEQIREIVPIDEWINSDYYVGVDQRRIYPYWKDFMIDIFREDRKPEEKITSVILSGCLTGDTKVKLVDGRNLSFVELEKEFGYNKRFQVYSSDKDGNIVHGTAHSVHKTKIAHELTVVTLSNGEKIKSTPDHKYLKADGIYCEAKDLYKGCKLKTKEKEEIYVNSIETIKACEFVYDLEVDSYNNFALMAGVLLHNSIGTGKTTIAELIMLRKMYELSCYRNVNSMFSLMSKTNILFLYFSVNKKQAERTGFGEFRSLTDNSPYFQDNFCRDTNINSILLYPEGITFAYGSSPSDSIGMSVICSMLDEANFMGTSAAPTASSEKATAMFANIVNRANSRFIVDGGVNHSLNILVSSSTFENSATERQMRLARENPHAIVAAPAQWDVKPNNFSKKYFYVFKGSNYLEASIVNSVDDVNNYRVSERLPKTKYRDGNSDYDSIKKDIEELPPHMQEKFLRVPVDLKAGFESDLIRSLQDIGGVSTTSHGKLFGSPAIYQDCVDKTRFHPFIASEIVVSTGNDISISSYMREDFTFRHPDRPRFIHIDQSIRTDSTGISCVYLEKYKNVGGVDRPVLGVDFMLRINPPPPPKRIAIYKIRNFITYLVEERGLNIGRLTYDIFNSEESRQILEEMGVNVGYLSVDRTDKPYVDLVEIMYEGRLQIYDYPILRYELLNLIHDRQRRKVDHPAKVIDGGYTDYQGKGNIHGERVGSKDVADSLCLTGDIEVVVYKDNKYSYIRIEELYRLYELDRDCIYLYKVVSYNKEDETVELSRIFRVIQRDYIPSKVYKIELNNGKYITCTEKHEILLDNNVFVEARHLKVGNLLKGGSDIPVEITNIQKVDNEDFVYDLSLIDVHNFLLSSGVFVHNCGAVENAITDKRSHSYLMVEGDSDTFIGMNKIYADSGKYIGGASSIDEMIDRDLEETIERLGF